MSQISAGRILVVLIVTVVLISSFEALGADEPIREYGVKIPLPGGGHLIADVVRPAAEGRFPTIYVHTCYGRRHVSSPAEDSPFLAELTAYDRYAYVATDWRGYPPPRGKPVDRSIDIGKDGAAAVEWIASRPWSDGKVGMWGHSAVAGAAFKVMREKPEHLVCAVPASGTDGLRYEQFFYGGVLEKQHWDMGTRVGHHVLKPLLTRNVYDWFWRAVDRRRKPMPSRIPLLLISGWFDTNPSLKLRMFDELRAAYGGDAARVSILAGPWQHAAFGMKRQGGVEFRKAEGATGRETLRFFDRHLRGADEPDRPAVTFFVMGRDEWVESDRWPPPSMPRTLHLTGDGELADGKPAEDARVEWTHDPEGPVPTTGGASILEREDVHRFVSAKLESEVVVAGRARVVLSLSSAREDTDIAVWLADVYPDGRAILAADGIQRLSFRESKSKPRPLVPGEIHEIAITLTPTAIAFQPGHRIMLVVASSNYPRFDKHPEKARNALHVGPDRLCRLVLPEIDPPRKPVKPGLHEFRIEVGGLERGYLVHVPKPQAPGGPCPLVLVFHGGGGTARGVMRETRWAEKAEAEGFVAVFPEGTRPDPDRPARFVGNPQTWNDRSGRVGVGAVERGVDDVEFVRRLLDDLEARFEIDRRRVYATGFSNGASMAFRVGRELAPRLAAIAPVAGSDWTDGPPGDGAPALLYITGTEDPLNPIAGGEVRIGRKSFGEKEPVEALIGRWAAGNAARMVTNEGGVKRVAYGSSVALVTVAGLGHHWPGGKSVLPERFAGPTSDALDATDLIWEFFRAAR